MHETNISLTDAMEIFVPPNCAVDTDQGLFTACHVPNLQASPTWKHVTVIYKIIVLQPWEKFLHDEAARNDGKLTSFQHSSIDLDAWFLDMCSQPNRPPWFHCECALPVLRHPNLEHIYVNFLAKDCDVSKHYVPHKALVGTDVEAQCLQMFSEMDIKTVDNGGPNTFVCGGMNFPNAYSWGVSYKDKLGAFDDVKDKQWERDVMRERFDLLFLLCACVVAIVYVLVHSYTFKKRTWKEMIFTSIFSGFTKT